MAFKKDVENEMSLLVERLRKRPNHNDEELMTIAAQMPVVAMKNHKLFVQFLDKHNLSLLDGATLLLWAVGMHDFVLKIDAEPSVTFDEMWRAYHDKVQVHFIIIHRVNHMLHECMIEVYDLLEREKRLKMAVKMCSKKAEDCWYGYYRPRQQKTEKTAWYTLQDHLRIAYDSVQPRLEKVYETLRDYMIRLGWRDVEVKARCCTALLMGKVVGASFRQFFKDFKKETHVDYSRCFVNDNLQPMVRNFAEMCKHLGMKIRTDKHGFYELDDFNPEDNQRFKWAWEDFMVALRDDDLMDESARHAIELNPKVNEDYKAALEEERMKFDEEERKKMEQETARLSEKYKVIRKAV